MINEDRPSISKFDEKTRKFTTSKTVNILNDHHLMNLCDQHQWQRHELSRRHEQACLEKLTSPIPNQSATSSIETNQSK